MRRKVSLVIIPIDDFTDEVIKKLDIAIKINEINREFIKKQEGFFIITDLEEDIIKINISVYSFIKVSLNVNLSELDKLNPVIKVRLKPNERYNFKSGITCIKGQTKCDSEILIIYENKSNTFRLLEDIDAEAESIRIYNPLNRKLEGSSIIIKDGTEQYDCNEILDFDSKAKRYILKNNVLNQYKRETSKVIKVDIVRTDKEGIFFAPIKNLSNQDNSVFIKTEDGILHNVKLQMGKINIVEF